MEETQGDTKGPETAHSYCPEHVPQYLPRIPQAVKCVLCGDEMFCSTYSVKRILLRWITCSHFAQIVTSHARTDGRTDAKRKIKKWKRARLCKMLDLFRKTRFCRLCERKVWVILSTSHFCGELPWLRSCWWLQSSTILGLINQIYIPDQQEAVCTSGCLCLQYVNIQGGKTWSSY